MGDGTAVVIIINKIREMMMRMIFIIFVTTKIYRLE